LRSVGHERAHMGRYWVGVDDIFDRVAPVGETFFNSLDNRAKYRGRIANRDQNNVQTAIP
jgi:hypothetical protein